MGSFVITAPGGANPSNFYATPTGVAAGKADANIRLDGDWTTAKCSGAPLVTRPFASEGDVTTKLVRQPVQQDLRYRQPLALGTAYRYPDEPTWTALHSTAILISETEPRDLGGNLGEWIRVYATLPPIRETPESFSMGYQYFTTSAISDGGTGTTASVDAIETLSLTMASKVRREYFLFKDLAKFPLLIAPKIVLIGKVVRKVGDGNLGPSTTITAFISTDDEFIAESSTYEYWQFPIMCRKTRYVPPPTDAFWGSALSLPSIPSS